LRLGNAMRGLSEAHETGAKGKQMELICAARRGLCRRRLFVEGRCN
jgi:hypothetical protein